MRLQLDLEKQFEQDKEPQIRARPEEDCIFPALLGLKPRHQNNERAYGYQVVCEGEKDDETCQPQDDA